MVTELHDADWRSGIDALTLPENLRAKLRSAVVAFHGNSGFPKVTEEEFVAITKVVFFLRFKPSGVACILEYKNKRLKLTKENGHD